MAQSVDAEISELLAHPDRLSHACDCLSRPHSAAPGCPVPGVPSCAGHAFCLPLRPGLKRCATMTGLVRAGPTTSAPATMSPSPRVQHAPGCPDADLRAALETVQQLQIRVHAEHATVVSLRAALHAVTKHRDELRADAEAVEQSLDAAASMLVQGGYLLSPPTSK